jgi:hypothetical protein
MKST